MDAVTPLWLISPCDLPLVDGPHVIGSMTGGGLSDEDTGDSDLSDSGPSGLELDDEGDEQGMGEQEDGDDLGSDDDF